MRYLVLVGVRRIVFAALLMNVAGCSSSSQTSTDAGVISTGASVTQQWQQDLTREVPYQGIEVAGDVFQCRSDKVVAGAFRRDLMKESVTEYAALTKETYISTWRVSVRGTHADVIGGGGAGLTVDDVKTFEVTRSASGLFAVRLSDKGFEAVSIDSANGSFVYVGHNLIPVKHGTNVFLGTCVPSV